MTLAPAPDPTACAARLRAATEALRSVRAQVADLLHPAVCGWLRERGGADACWAVCETCALTMEIDAALREIAAGGDAGA